ncbi:hypothetical protein GCM10011499_14950 [Pelagibacterium lentulum]|uniref:Uncharacterized protein n=1 Tax=Pelagibacterium lentulum TaxID=2029865 RepID=A0A916R9I0_9HYPH|nr:hypothetical protein GCM10011499_14950 [Pelagibacterium lentulum]
MIDILKGQGGRGYRFKNEHAGTAPGLYKSICPQCRNSLTHDSSADAMCFRQSCFAGQFVAWLKIPGADGVPQGFGNLDNQCAAAAGAVIFYMFGFHFASRIAYFRFSIIQVLESDTCACDKSSERGVFAPVIRQID